MKMKRGIFLLALTLGISIAHAGSYDPQDLIDGYSYLNQLRVRAGMTEFSANPQLEQAAFNHANYLVDNFMVGHYESAGTTGFTGVRVNDRVVFAGYRSTFVSENVSSGSRKSKDAIDGLMSAIYHRFGFLDFVNNEIGIGIGMVTSPNFHSAYVFNMGNSDYNTLCHGASFTGTGVYHYGICEPDIHIGSADFSAVAIGAQGNNPYIVQWPADGDNDVPPAFFEESPDPLPDYSVSGYPLSVQFNPLTFTDVGVDVTEFKIYRESDNVEIQPTRLLTESTDPSGKFSALEYALFPLVRLDWNTAYRVEVGYVTNSSAETLTWRFTTRDLGVPLYTVRGEGEEILLSSNTEEFAFYVPPTSSFPDLGGRLSFSYSGGMTIVTEFEDGNTVLVNMTGNVGQHATFTFSGERSFIVKISANVADENISGGDDNNEGSNNNEGKNESELIDAEVSTEACEPVIVSSEGKVHIPALTYVATSGATPKILWANLEFVNDSQLQITNYGSIVTTDCAETVTVSPELNMHISTLYYIPFSDDDTFWVLRANLEFNNGLFEVSSVDFIN